VQRDTLLGFLFDELKVALRILMVRSFVVRQFGIRA
jgi:hypothetical protein